MLTKLLAGGFGGIGSLLLIWQGYTEAGTGILSLMVGYFIADRTTGAKE